MSQRSTALLSDAARGGRVSGPVAHRQSTAKAEAPGSVPGGTIGSVAHQQSVRRNEPEGTRGSTSRVREPALYVIARADLEVGFRTAQVGHALIQWTLEHGRPPESLVVLSAPDLDALHRAHDRLVGRVVAFHEPDLDDQLTAVAAGPECWRALSSLPLLR